MLESQRDSEARRIGRGGGRAHVVVSVLPSFFILLILACGRSADLASPSVPPASASSLPASPPPAPVFTEQRFPSDDTNLESSRQLPSGADCSKAGAGICKSRVCLHASADPHNGFLCSNRCVDTMECPAGWRCVQTHPSPGSSLCVPGQHVLARRPQ